MSQLCRKCGKQISEQAKFCDNCGTAASTLSNKMSDMVTSPQNSEAKSTSAKRKRIPREHEKSLLNNNSKWDIFKFFYWLTDVFICSLGVTSFYKDSTNESAIGKISIPLSFMVLLQVLFIPLYLLIRYLVLQKLQKRNWKENISKRMILIAIAVVVSLSSFYWIFVRPTNVRKNCNKRALNSAITKYGDSNRYEFNVYNHLYTRCLRDKGL